MNTYWAVDGEASWARTAESIGVSATPMPQGVWWEVSVAGDVHRIVHTPRLLERLIARYGAPRARRMMEHDGGADWYYRLALQAEADE